MISEGFGTDDTIYNWQYGDEIYQWYNQHQPLMESIFGIEKEAVVRVKVE